jgi:hypothetical protein
MHGTPIPVPSLDASQATPTATPTTTTPPLPLLGEKWPVQDDTSPSHTNSLICLDSNVMCQGKCASFALILDTGGISSDTGDILLSTSNLPS